MNWLAIGTSQNLAHSILERTLNALPEGLLIAFFAWALLRILPRQNSGTRFAVWFVVLLTIVSLPFISALGTGPISVVSGVHSLAPYSIPTLSVPAHWGTIVFSLWAIGAGLGLARLAFGMWSLIRLRQSCISVAATDLDPALRQTLADMDASVTITTSERVRVPAAIGFWKRTIVLPPWALHELAPEDLLVIVLHESAHLSRGDDWTNLIQKVVRAVFFFHPGVWWIENQLSVEREMACDDAVLAQTANPHGYASCLVSLLEKSVAQRAHSRRWSMAQAAVHRVQEAALRLARILDANRPVATKVWKPALGITGMLSLACLLVLPHAPQFVTFEHVADHVVQHQVVANGSVDPTYAALVHQVSFRPAITSAKTVATEIHSGKRAIKRLHANTAQRIVTRASVQLEEAPQHEQLIAVSMNDDRDGADANSMPQFPTLIFVQMTGFIISDSQGWRMQVMRITFVNFDGGRAIKAVVPVVRSI